MASALQLLSDLTSPITILKGGTPLQTRPRIDFIAGTNVTINVTDNAANYKTDITINSAGSGTGGTVTSVDGSGGSTGLTLTGGPITTTGTLTLGGTLVVASGGTGVSTFTPGYVKGNLTSALSTVATIPGGDITGNISGNSANVTGIVAIANGGTNATTAVAARTSLGLVIGTDVLAPNGSAAALTSFPTFNQNTTGTASNVTGTVAIANGGTGQTSQQAALNALAGGVTTGYYLRGNGANVLLAQLSASDFTTGTLGVAYGGTGTTSFTAGYLKANGTSAFTTNSVIPVSDLSGTVAIANGGTGSTSASGARTNLGLGSLATQNGTFSGTSSGTNTGDQTISITGDVTASGSTGALTATVGKINGVALIGLGTGILKNSTVTGQPSIAIASDFPTLNQNTTGTAANVTGTVAIANGGTGQTTANTAFNALAPSQGGNSGKYLTTNGTSSSWANFAALSVASRSDLRAYTGAVNKQFIVEQGYYYEGDGGGGVWFFDSGDTASTDNDGTLVVPGGSYGTAATAGCWHRVGPGSYGHGINDLNSTTLDVRWFGAIPNESDIVTSVNHAFASLNNQPGVKQYGCLYFPSGTYYFGSKVVFNGANLGNLGITIKGDGPGATTFAYGLTAADTCMIEIKNFTGGSFQDLSIQWFGYSGIVDSPSVLWIHDTTYFSLQNVQGQNHISTAVNGDAGGVVRLENNTSMTMNGLIFGGSRAGGTQLYFGGGSGTYSNSSFLTGTNAAPCFRMPACNSIQLNNLFFQGGGPLIRQTGASITSNGSYFTVTKTNHLFITGEYVVISGATYSGYNGRWKIASVPNANTLTITSSLSLSSDTVTINTLPACALFAGVSGQAVTESQMQGCFFNTPSTGPGIGSVGIFIDGWRGNIGQLSIADSLTDYGYTSVFALGRTNSDPGSSLSSVSISNLRQNTGAADDFGFIRLEGVANITVDGVRDFPGDNVTPGTGKTFNAVVISDGGQAYLTQEITITGGNFTNLNSSALYTSAIINAFVFDGPNVKNVRIVNPGVDSSNSGRTYPVSVTKYINGASASNGISVVYADSSGLINLGSASITGGYAVLSIAQCDQVKLVPELGYGTSGSVTVRLDLKTSVYIGLTGNTTFAFTGMASGSYIFLTLKNTTGSAISLSWPAINWSSVATPTSLAAGGSLLMRVFAFGTTYSDTFAAY